jgi:hypothetical protein
MVDTAEEVATEDVVDGNYNKICLM